MALAFAGAQASTASAQTGGAVSPGAAPAAPTTTTSPTAATLLPNGVAVAPAGAPQAVVNAIAAGNQIRNRKYVYGGGHRSFFSRGYDCSGAVSYVLHAAGVLASPLPSGPFMSWATPGAGSWITTYANGGHMFVVIAGLRWDTSAAFETVRRGKAGTGPRWRNPRPLTGFVARHPLGL